jgi:hypothetical protein
LGHGVEPPAVGRASATPALAASASLRQLCELMTPLSASE